LKISKYDEIEILASDGVFNATKILRIHVNDVNDNLPEFTKSQSLINITEDTEIGALIGEFCAKDVDSLDEKLNFIILSNAVQESYRLLEGNFILLNSRDNLQSSRFERNLHFAPI
jgi:hypothetical protein